jgi:hypothetical protein
VILTHRQKATATNCWICEDWTQIKVSWSPKEMGWSGRFLEKFAMRSHKVEPIYLHSDIDEFEPSFMPKNATNDEYELVRAVPRGVVPKWFITHRGMPKISNRYEMISIDSPISREMHYTELSVVPVHVMIVQTVEPYGGAADIFGKFDAVPRFDSDIVKPEIIKDLSEWTIEKSFFKDMVIKKETYDKCLG